MTNTDRYKYAEIYVDRSFKQSLVCAALNCTASFENFEEFWKHVDRVHWKDCKTGSHGDFEKTVADKKAKATVDLTESDCEDDIIAIVDILRGPATDEVGQASKGMRDFRNSSDIRDEPPTCVLTPQPSPSISLGAYELDNVSCRVSRNSNSTNTENDASTSQGSATTFNQHQNNSMKQQKICQTTESLMLRQSSSNKNHPQPAIVQMPLTPTSVNGFDGHGNSTTSVDQHQHNYHNQPDFSERKDEEGTEPQDLSFNTRATTPPSDSLHQAQQSMARSFQNSQPDSSSPCEMDNYETWRLTRCRSPLHIIITRNQNSNVTAPSSSSLDNITTTSTNNTNTAIQQKLHSPTTQQRPHRKCAKRRSTINIDTPHKLQARRKTVAGPFKCDLCFQKTTFHTQIKYDAHVKRYHSPQDPSSDTVYCETCNDFLLATRAQGHPHSRFHLNNLHKKMNGLKVNRRRKQICEKNGA